MYNIYSLFKCIIYTPLQMYNDSSLRGCANIYYTRLTRPVSLVEQDLLTLPVHLSSPPVFSGVRVTRSLVLYVCFVDRCLYFFF